MSMSRRSFSSWLISSAAAILILAAGCSDQTLTSTQLTKGYNPVKLPAADLAPSFSKSGPVQQVIGPEGGVIQTDRITISFPKDALSAPTAISVSPDAQNLAVTFAPHGIQFPAGKEPTVTFSYKGISDLPEQKLEVLYVSASGEILERLSATLDTKGKTATRNLRHFSQYALAWP